MSAKLGGGCRSGSAVVSQSGGVAEDTFKVIAAWNWTIIVLVYVQSGLRPDGLPVADAEALCGVMREAGRWYEVRDDVVGECMDDYPGHRWDVGFGRARGQNSPFSVSVPVSGRTGGEQALAEYRLCLG